MKKTSSSLIQKELKIEVNRPEEEVKMLHDKLEKFEKQFCPAEFIKSITHNYLIKDKNDELIGGVNFWISFGTAYVKDIWIREDYRGQGIASDLMRRVEAFARKKGAVYVALETMEFEGPEFYRKIGYKQEHERKRIYGTYSQYSFIKKL